MGLFNFWKTSGSVAMCFRFGGIFSDCFIANLLLNVAVKNIFRELVNI